ncbi:uncharacterized protein LOC121378878 [Gigantopelta aegis]|uniref:uncharacterized protein LOC121378878 n=1 Tax=Gigantopelta aegis TaxID=1735272 RepID=UPI001B88D31E|nr:uncharacterized protein LOC121378878 [Gigantopelta aegis]XP_041363167.1 uncharacterized protein LOC121378878 [Gigantopelta aegis]
MRLKPKTLITVCSLCLISLFWFGVYTFGSKHIDGIHRRLIHSDVGTHGTKNVKNTADLTSNHKKPMRISDRKRKLHKYKTQPQSDAEAYHDNEDDVDFDAKAYHDNEDDVDFEKSKKSSSHGRKYLIYLCMYNESCSGWADRQRAIVSGFLLAQIKHRRFGIILTSPCDLRMFFVPNEYNWIVNENELVGLSTATPPDSFLRKIDVVDFDKAYPEDLVYFRSHRDLLLAIKENPIHAKSIPQWAKYRKPIAFKNGWNILMKRTPQFDKTFQKLMSGVPSHSQFVCAHVRLSKNPTMPMETRVINTYSSVKYLWAFLDTRYPNASRIFVATDSLDVRKWARRHFKDKEMDTGKTILHIEKQKRKKNSCDGFESVLLDQQVMIHCDVLVCSYSNICKHAVYINGMRDNAFLFKREKIHSVQFTWPEIYE